MMTFTRIRRPTVTAAKTMASVRGIIYLKRWLALPHRGSCRRSAPATDAALARARRIPDAWPARRKCVRPNRRDYDRESSFPAAPALAVCLASPHPPCAVLPAWKERRIFFSFSEVLFAADE